MDFLQPLGRLPMNFEVIVFLEYLGLEGLRLRVQHGDVDDAVRLEPRNVEVDGWTVADLLGHQLDVVHDLIVLVLDRRYC